LDEAFPFGSSREMAFGHIHVRASRITYVGELGWELYVQLVEEEMERPQTTYR
jgi:4-methylaminobutanoate oxidase (formaldehyde-forming)